MPLMAPVADVNRQHLQKRAQQVLAWTARTLREAGIVAKLKMAVGAGGRPTIVVLTQQPTESYLTLPPVIGGIFVHIA